jgi:SAM-dependent methyltransferase
MHPLLEASHLPLRITGIDVAPGVIELARRANPNMRYDVYAGDVLPYANGEFDAAVTVTVVHHVPPPRWFDFLNEMRRVVRPGGILAVFEHNPYNPLTLYVVRTCPLDENAVLLSSRRLSKLLRATGLQDVQSRFILSTPFESRLFRWLDKAIGWLPLGAQYYVTGHVPL